jgi:hypothetical protein
LLIILSLLRCGRITVFHFASHAGHLWVRRLEDRFRKEERRCIGQCHPSHITQCHNRIWGMAIAHNKTHNSDRNDTPAINCLFASLPTTIHLQPNFQLQDSMIYTPLRLLFLARACRYCLSAMRAIPLLPHRVSLPLPAALQTRDLQRMCRHIPCFRYLCPKLTWLVLAVLSVQPLWNSTRAVHIVSTLLHTPPCCM